VCLVRGKGTIATVVTVRGKRAVSKLILGGDYYAGLPNLRIFFLS
jgi:hypothetical protein